VLRSRRIVASVLAVGALVVTASCSSGDNEPATRVTPTPTQTGPTLLTFAVYGPPQVVTAYTKIAADSVKVTRLVARSQDRSIQPCRLQPGSPYY